MRKEVKGGLAIVGFWVFILLMFCIPEVWLLKLFGAFYVVAVSYTAYFIATELL